MEKKVSIYSDAWCDMVFEKKNKDYGAFILRKRSTKSHAMAVIITAVVFSLSVSAPLLIQGLTKSLNTGDVTPVDLRKFKVVPPTVKPPVVEDLKPVQKAMRPAIFVVKPDDQADDESKILTDDELMKMKNFTDDDNDSVNLADLDKKKKVIDDDGRYIKPYVFVEKMPEFPGGEEEMMKFITSHVVYPGAAIAANIEGTVHLKFVVTATGKVTDITVQRGVEGGCTEEAVRVAQLMPDWKPGMQNGTAVPVYFNLPIKFILKSN